MNTENKRKLIEQYNSCESAQMFHELMHNSARKALLALMDEEVEMLCGSYYHPDEESQYSRAGSTPTSAYIFTEKEEILRPRVRFSDGSKNSEIELNTYKAAKDPQLWEESVMRAILSGVSTRKIACLSKEELKGTSKSKISRLWKERATQYVDEFHQRDLSDIDLLVIMIDAIVLASDITVIAAIGVDTSGKKHILGYKEGSSENQEVCLDLLKDLGKRGLKEPRKRYLLAVLDGHQGLKKAVLKYFSHVIIQRCLVHKERNLRGYLPKKYWSELAKLFSRLRHSQGVEHAREVKKDLIDFLSDKNEQAKNSLEEADGELIAFLELNAPNTLNVSLLSTNLIENVFNNLRRHLGRVCKWNKDSTQVDQWVSSGLLLAEKGFKRIKGYAEIPKLIKSLEAKLIEKKATKSKT